MDSTHSVSVFLDQLKTQHDSDVAGEIWQRYMTRLLPLASKKLRGLRNPAVDADDIMVSVFDRFFQAVKEDRFAKLDTRDDLWQILLVLTDRKVADQYRRANATKRGSGRVTSIEGLGGEDSTTDYLRELADQSPSPEFAVSFANEVEVALGKLDETARRVATLRMEGFATREIAEELGISLSSVERKLRLIRSVWNEMLPDA